MDMNNYGSMCESLYDYCEAQDLEHMCAQDLLAEDLTQDQRDWLSSFVEVWDRMSTGE